MFREYRRQRRYVWHLHSGSARPTERGRKRPRRCARRCNACAWMLLSQCCTVAPGFCFMLHSELKRSLMNSQSTLDVLLSPFSNADFSVWRFVNHHTKKFLMVDLAGGKKTSLCRNLLSLIKELERTQRSNYFIYQPDRVVHNYNVPE